MKTKEFVKFENLIFSEYGDNLIYKLPIMNKKVNNRVNLLMESESNQFNFEFSAVDNYPMRGYFKIELFFKLFLFFLLFGIHMKGYNIPIFISILIIYYW
jgi:hypothetical protein